MANKVIVLELPPFLLAGIRFCTAAAIVFMLCRLFKVPIRISREHLKNTFIAGLFFLTIGNGLAVWALQFVDSGFSAIVISAQPLVLLVMMRILDKKPFMLRSIAGVSLGMIGIYLLVSQDALISTPDQWKGLFALFICLLAWGYGSMFVSKAALPSNHFLNGAYQMLFGGLMMLVLSFFFGEDAGRLASVSDRAAVAMIYLIVFGSIVAFTSFNFLLKRISPEKVSTSTYVNPIVAMICGWYFLDEVITNTSILATVILLTGVYFINSARFTRRRSVIPTKEISP